MSDMFKPYFAVIFSSQRTTADNEGYENMSSLMIELAQTQNGFLGVESVRSLDGSGITISYWESEEHIKTWKHNAEHQIAQNLGRSRWYKSFRLRVCKVEREYGLE